MSITGTVLIKREHKVPNVDIFGVSSLIDYLWNFHRARSEPLGALIGKAQDDVAQGSGVDKRIVIRLEKASYTKPTEAAHRVRRYYEGKGIEFLAADDQPDLAFAGKQAAKKDFFRRRQVQAARVMINLSQTQLALRLGVVRSVVTKYENGAVKTPDPAFIEQAVRTLEGEGVSFLADTAAKGAGVRAAFTTATEDAS